ncbi:MAG: cation:proton antiporter [Actinobacteria bacterium]|nr:cation:proton antiporter [Actinomycetota bacterium]
MAGSVLTDVLLILAVAVAVSLLLARLGLPLLIGLFAAGVLVGPHTFGLIEDPRRVEALADVGVVFLLFALGLEFSFPRLLGLWRPMLIGGPVQVVLTGILAFGISLVAGTSATEAIVLGGIVSLSSTAVVLRTLDERQETGSPQGRNALGILIFQDILFVPLIVILPLLGGQGPGQGLNPYTVVGAAAGLVVAVIVGTRWVVPWLLRAVTQTRSSEVFLLAVIAICLGVAALTAQVGLSLALGAFLAGLIISEEYSHQALGYILPLRNVFVSFFFVSVGMLLDLGFLASKWWLVVAAAIGIIVVKSLTGTAAVLVLRYPLRTAFVTGISIAQVGEFSFVLAAIATGAGLFSSGLRQGFLAVAVLTMAATPMVISVGPTLSRKVAEWRLPPWLLLGRPAEPNRQELFDHLLIIGFGLNGRNLAKASKAAELPYVIVEMNPRTVAQEFHKGEPIVMGDADNEGVLRHAGAQRARVAAVVIGDPSATRSIVSRLRRLSPALHIIARTRFLAEVEQLYALGADVVVPEEFETSLAIFSQTLQRFAMPTEEIEHWIRRFRCDHYEVLRGEGEGGDHCGD